MRNEDCVWRFRDFLLEHSIRYEETWAITGQSKKLLSGYTEHATIAMVTTLCGFIACNVQCWLDIRWVVKDRR